MENTYHSSFNIYYDLRFVKDIVLTDFRANHTQHAITIQHMEMKTKNWKTQDNNYKIYIIYFITKFVTSNGK